MTSKANGTNVYELPEWELPMTPHDFVEAVSINLAPEFTRYLETGRNDFPWGDHAKVVGPYYLSRPYEISFEVLEKLFHWAKHYKFRVDVFGASTWDPRTLTIQVSREDITARFEKSARSRGGEDFLKAVNRVVNGEIYRGCNDNEPNEQVIGYW